MQNRRDFLKVLAGAGAACAASGCATKTGWPFAGTQGSPMHRYAAAPIKDLKVGVVGIGGRGGAWRTNKPMDIVDIDLNRFGVANA